MQVSTLLWITESLTFVARKLHTVVPFTVLRYAHSGEFNDNIHWFHVLNIAGQEGSHAVAVLHTPIYVVVNFYGSVYI